MLTTNTPESAETEEQQEVEHEQPRRFESVRGAFGSFVGYVLPFTANAIGRRLTTTSPPSFPTANSSSYAPVTDLPVVANPPSNSSSPSSRDTFDSDDVRELNRVEHSRALEREMARAVLFRRLRNIAMHLRMTALASSGDSAGARPNSIELTVIRDNSLDDSVSDSELSDMSAEVRPGSRLVVIDGSVNDSLPIRAGGRPSVSSLDSGEFVIQSMPEQNLFSRVGHALWSMIPHPFGHNGNDTVDEEDDPAFQQLLCLSGLFCGPIMFFIGGVLFCVMPREQVQARKWAFLNLVLSVLSLMYLVSVTEWEVPAPLHPFSFFVPQTLHPQLSTIYEEEESGSLRIWVPETNTWRDSKEVFWSFETDSDLDGWSLKIISGNPLHMNKTSQDYEAYKAIAEINPSAAPRPIKATYPLSHFFGPSSEDLKLILSQKAEAAFGSDIYINSLLFQPQGHFTIEVLYGWGYPIQDPKFGNTNPSMCCAQVCSTSPTAGSCNFVSWDQLAATALATVALECQEANSALADENAVHSFSDLGTAKMVILPKLHLSDTEYVEPGSNLPEFWSPQIRSLEIYFPTPQNAELGRLCRVVYLYNSIGGQTPVCNVKAVSVHA